VSHFSHKRDRENILLTVWALPLKTKILLLNTYSSFLKSKMERYLSGKLKKWYELQAGRKYYLRSGVKLNLRTHRKQKVWNREKDVHNICRGD